MSFSPRKIDFFHPYIIPIAILIFLVMGYIGSFNYRFEDPLNTQTILTIIFAALLFAIAAFITSKKFTIEKSKEINFLSEKIIVILITFLHIKMQNNKYKTKKPFLLNDFF